MNKDKRGQSQIITTVLIILLVLAAIVIVWQVINNMVGKSATSAEQTAACIGLDLDIVGVTNSPSDLNVTVTRKAGGPEDKVTLTLLVDGVVTDYDGSDVELGPLESGKLGYGAYGSDTVPDKVEVGAKIGDTTCSEVACWGTGC